MNRFGPHRTALALGFALCLTTPLAAQQDQRGYLQAFLEDNLSSDGMQVQVTGLTGTLSSIAQIEELTLSDDQGVWLRLSGVTLDWNRATLLSGAVEVNALTAQEIDLSRLPILAKAAPVAEATGPFTLPELPVSVQIGRIAAEKLTLGQPVLGQPVTASLEGSASIADGQGQGSLHIERLDDGPTGALSLDVGFVNQTGQLSISLIANEAQGGIAASLIGLPGLPSTDLRVIGAGPLSDFRADLGLSTDGETRLAGALILSEMVNNGVAIQGFSAQLSGNPAPLFVPEYAGFLGDSIALDVTGTLPARGGLDLSKLHLSARSLQLDGSLALAADGLPDAFDLTGQIALPDGTPVLLPLSGDGQTRLTKATMQIGFDGRSGNEGWTADIAVQGLDQPDLQLSNLALKSSGRISRKSGPARIGGALTWTAEGVSPTDAAIARALGSVLWGGTRLHWSKGSGALSLRDLSLQGEDYQLTGVVDLNTLSSDSLIDVKANLTATDLSRFADLAGMPLTGSADSQITASLNPLTGGADIDLTAKGQAIALGIAPLDRLLSGTSTVLASVRRDAAGINLRNFRAESGSFLATAQGTVSSGSMNLTAQTKLDRLADLGPGFGGAINADLGITGTPDAPVVALAAKGQNLAIGQPEADKLIAGTTSITARVAGRDGIWAIEDLSLTGPQLTATGKGQTDGATTRMQIDARLRNLGLFLPEYPGAMTIGGEIGQSVNGYRLNLKGNGPGGIDMTAAGTVSAGFDSADLTVKGRANAALANPFLKPRSLAGGLGFDLAIKGPLGLNAVSGPIVLTNGRLADPSLPFNLTDLAATIRLGAGKASIDTTAAITSGGSVSVKGDLSLSAPFVARLGIDIAQARLRDPALYDVPLSGKLSLNGPLLGSGGLLSGRIDIGKAELRLPSTGLTGADLLPGLQHLAEPAGVNATRHRAGMIEDAMAAQGRTSNLGLDLLLSAPSQVFLRGRGLDAELGGELRLTGTLSLINPQGGIALIRGRLDILGKRLVLSRANITMEGALIPTLDIAADTESANHTVSVTIDGPATDPKVGFASSPELPEEEVLALLLFDRDSQSLSPLQALQLAEAVAQLAGRGGEGTISRLRKGAGLDNLDVKTNAAGESTVTAGKYLTEKIYSEIAVEQNGKSQINLNLNLNATTKLRARTNSEGSSGIGIVVEKDY
jgi:translocation and assembly module TamB